jgi:hypothetical protein
MTKKPLPKIEASGVAVAPINFFVFDFSGLSFDRYDFMTQALNFRNSFSMECYKIRKIININEYKFNELVHRK